jgi:hypothetical protein
MFPIKITLHYTSGEKLPPYLRLPEKAIVYSVAIKGDQRLLEVCLPFSFLDRVQGRKLGTLRPFGINYRSDFSCYYLLGGILGYYNLPPRQSFFLKEFPASLNFSLDVFF